jgi:pimeloyl-ACP methyl ester carboxylesterase
MNRSIFINGVVAIVIAAVNTSSQMPSTTGNSKPQGPAVFVEEASTLETPTGSIYGTLMLPKGKDAFPWCSLSQARDPRQERQFPNSEGPNNSLKMLAEGLAANGIASLRYDKRGIGESAKAMGKEADLRFDDYINDAAFMGKKTARRQRFSTLTIAGHSEGSLIGMVAAERAQADAYVSIAGVGKPVSQLLLEQLRKQLPPETLKSAEAIMAGMAAGKTTDPVPPDLMAMFRPSVQPYMISWFRYDPAKEIGKLSVPILIAQGTTDIQVGVDEARSLSTGAPSAKLLLIDGMNHVLKNVPIDTVKQIASYSDASLPTDALLISEMSAFVKKVRSS